MTVQKHKPSHTPHSSGQKIAEIAADVEKTVQAARDTIRRSKKLVSDSRQALEKSRANLRKRA